MTPLMGRYGEVAAGEGVASIMQRTEAYLCSCSPTSSKINVKFVVSGAALLGRSEKGVRAAFLTLAGEQQQGAR